jgi:hypothetical protein
MCQHTKAIKDREALLGMTQEGREKLVWHIRKCELCKTGSSLAEYVATIDFVYNLRIPDLE